jgi:hypothetical protein
VILVPHAKAAQRHARQETASAKALGIGRASVYRVLEGA